MGPLNGTDDTFNRSKKSMGGDVVFTWGIVSAWAAGSQERELLLPWLRIVTSGELALSGGTRLFASLPAESCSDFYRWPRSAQTANGNPPRRVFGAGLHWGGGWNGS